MKHQTETPKETYEIRHDYAFSLGSVGSKRLVIVTRIYTDRDPSVFFEVLHFRKIVLQTASFTVAVERYNNL